MTPPALPPSASLSASPSWGILVVVVLLTFVVGALFGGGRVRRERSLVVRRRAGRAVLGEREAAALLEGFGFAIEGRQVVAGYDLRVDGALVPIELRADYLVTRDRRRFVAEVKTGAVAPNVTTASTRRQLLEYRLAFDVDGVILVDAEARVLHAVEFPLAEAAIDARPHRSWWPWAVGLAAAAALWWTFAR